MRPPQPISPETAPEADSLLLALADATEQCPRRFGDFDVVGRLGEGGMGAVYEAIDRNRGSRVALKTIRRGEPGRTQGIKREFRVVADLVHENLVPVYELAHAEGLWFFTMELVQGVSFTSWLRNAKAAGARPTQTTLTLAAPMGSERSLGLVSGVPATPPDRSEEEVRAAFRQLVRGVAALHSVGLRHGDIKPSNVIVRPDGRVVIVDFGLSSSFRESGHDAASPFGGTPLYMSPEQLKGDIGGPEADWYAAGIMLYMALTGRYPFASDSAIEAYLRKTLGLAPAPARLLSVPDGLSALCLALLQPSPEERPDSSQILSYLAGEIPERRSRAERDGSSVAGRALFVGRQDELWRLEHAYRLTQENRTIVTHVHGPSGIGKSSVVGTFLDGVRNVAFARVLCGRCYERESVPYKAFDKIVDELATWLVQLGERTAELLPARVGELAQVFPALLTVPAIADRARAHPRTVDIADLPLIARTALSELLCSLSRIQPLVLYIDDLHWADSSSAAMLETLLDANEPARMLIVANFRDRAARSNPALGSYLSRIESDADRLVDVPISALSMADSERMARAVLTRLEDAVDDATVRSVASESQGLPFLVEQLSRYAAAHPGEPEGVSLLRVIAARMKDLPAEQRALLEVAAVADSPISQPVIFEAAGSGPEALSALLALRHASLIRWTGPDVGAAVGTYHDGIREAVVHVAGAEVVAGIHRRLARARIAHREESTRETWVFDVVRHLNSAGPLRNREERLEAARLNLAAGNRAKGSAAFGLARRCFEAGIGFLETDGWEEQYRLSIELHSGAAETAYLVADWAALKRRAAEVKANGHTVMDQLAARTAEIDAYIGHQDYAEAVRVGCEALDLLGVSLPVDPTPDEVATAFQRALEELTKVGVDGLLAMPDVDDPAIAAAMAIQVRVSPAAYYAKPSMLPVIACNLVVTSVERGLSTATPYALAIFGVVLNGVGMHALAHQWGLVAEGLLERWPDRKLEVCTRHVLHCLVCAWMVPMQSTLEPLRAVFSMGTESGDLEYASYAAHGYTYNAINAARPLGPLRDEALEFGRAMRSLGQVNAVHVHAPFEQVLRCLTAENPDSSCLDGHGFVEADELASARQGGSRHGLFILHYTMGLMRFHFGDAGAAHTCFQHARGYLDAAASAWHVPMLHQFAALAACRSWREFPQGERAAIRADIDASLEALRTLGEQAPFNFAHRAELVEGAIAAMEGEAAAALEAFGRAIVTATAGGWTNDVALAHELAARSEQRLDARHARLLAARAAYDSWGATAKVAELDLLLAARTLAGQP